MDYKLILVGDDTAAYGTGVKRFELHTTYGVVHLNTWYIMSEEDNPLFKNCYCIGGQGAIIIFDMLDPLAFKNVQKLYGDLCVVCPGIHVYLCGTYKEDFLRFESWNKTVNEFHSFVRHNDLDISAFPFGDITMDPFLALVRKLTGFQDLMIDRFVEYDDVDDDHQDDGSSDEAESSEDDDIGLKGNQLQLRRARRARQQKRRQQRKRGRHRH